MSRELWEADRLADRSMAKPCPDAAANGAAATRESSHSANGAGATRAIDPQADGQADVCECPACAIAAFPCLSDPPPLDGGRGLYAGLARGPVQDETQFSHPLDRAAEFEIGSGAFDNRTRR